MNEIDEINEALRAGDPSQINCDTCGKLVVIEDTIPCSFCIREYVCSNCQIWYRNSEKDPVVPDPIKGNLKVLPSHYRPYYKHKNPNPTIVICKICDIEVEALFVKNIPYTQIPKYLNFPFIHEENKALLLKRASY